METYVLKCRECNISGLISVELPEELTKDQLDEIENGESVIELTQEQAFNDPDLGLSEDDKSEIKARGSYNYNVPHSYDICSACGTDQN